MEIDQSYCRDCIEGMAEIRDESDLRFDLILTDPPYGMKYRVPSTTKNSYSGDLRKIQGDDDVEIFSIALPYMHDLLGENGVMLCFCAGHPDLYYKFYKLVKDAGFYYLNTIVWDKQILAIGQQTYYRPQYEYIIYAAKSKHSKFYFNGETAFQQGNIISYPRINLNITGSTDDTRRIHPNQKPVPMLRRLIQTHCPPGGIVLDPFAGSNSTAIAAWQEKRHYITFEKQPEYYDAGMKILTQVKNQLTIFEED